MHFFSVVAIAVFATFIPAIGTAQTVTFDALSKYVDVGDLVTVTAADGTRSSGRITALTGLSLELKVDSGNAWFSGSTLRRVQVNDSLANGSIIGLVAGAVPGAIVGNLSDSFATTKLAAATPRRWSLAQCSARLVRASAPGSMR